jgi:hypothetical protein
MAVIVIIYDDIVRPDTTGVYCEAALRRTGHTVLRHRPHVRDGDRLVFTGYAGLPREADLYLQIDDDLGYPGPPTDRLKAYWCIDTHRMDRMVGAMTRYEKMRDFDVVFAAQRDMAERLGAVWLPLACDARRWHRMAGVAKIHDWCFVGNLPTEERRGAVAALQKAHPNGFVGQVYGPGQNRVYNASRLILNISIENDVNMRFFEAQAAGGPLLSNRPGNGEDELFSDVFYYDAPEALPERVAELLADPKGLALAAHAQWKNVLARHTYDHRMATLLAHLGFPASPPPGASP